MFDYDMLCLIYVLILNSMFLPHALMKVWLAINSSVFNKLA